MSPNSNLYQYGIASLSLSMLNNPDRLELEASSKADQGFKLKLYVTWYLPAGRFLFHEVHRCKLACPQLVSLLRFNFTPLRVRLLTLRI
jgi:hypothetical protein